MNPIKKIKSRRGITLVEVLIVVAMMGIMLGIAMPNLLSESQAIRLTAMNGYARSVAVAVQSKLYGMKNKGTEDGSEFFMLGKGAAETEIKTEEGPKIVKYFANFGETEKTGKQILSGAITDVELLKGNIVVVYSPDTADVLEVFYAEKEFSVDKDNDNLFPTVIKSYLDRNEIGLYRGDPNPELKLNIGLPRFSVGWDEDNEKYLELTMINDPEPELMDKHLGLEIYALLPIGDDKKLWDPLLIYAEGLIASDYTTDNVVEPYFEGKKNSPASKTIKAESDEKALLTLGKIKGNGGKLRFSIDSLVIQRVNYDSVAVKEKLYRQLYPTYVSAAEPKLYPRDSIDNWLNLKYNPYISFGIDAGYDISEDLLSKLKRGAGATEYVGVKQDLELQVKLYVLEQDEKGNYTTEPIGNDGLASRYIEDKEFEPVYITSTNASPYFTSFANDSNEASISSVRGLQNLLKYGFENGAGFETARLTQNIDTAALYEKLVFIRYALIEKEDNVKSLWPAYANADALSVSACRYADGEYTKEDGSKQKFKITGKKEEGEGCFSIINLQTGSDTWGLAGLILYAKNISVENLDIVNPKSTTMNYNTGFIKTDDEGKITGIDTIQWDSGISGGLFGVAENCTFTNVRCYNDDTQNFKKEADDAVKYNKDNMFDMQMSARSIAANVVGGLVGIAIGTNEETTQFENCGASTQITTHYLRMTTECLYAGGLVGIAMGNVSINNSYAACQLSGYYSGGLVGAEANGAFKSVFREDYANYEAKYESVQGTLKITNSFAAGRIQRQTRVGGGLIAQVADSEKVNATNCYSATTWEILPPVAYGTFEGDSSGKNYYLVQKEINVPITLNTEAHFTREAGDVFSLSDKKYGVAVTSSELKSKLSEGWEDSSHTLEWRYVNSTTTYSTSKEGEGYPYPMPSGNTMFWGDWNHDATDITNVSENFDYKFEGFYCVYYNLSGQSNVRNADVATIFSYKFDFTGDTPTLNGKEIKNEIKEREDIWWGGYDTQYYGPLTKFTTGVAGMTDVTVEAGNVTFKGGAYYNANYKPTKRYEGIDITQGQDADKRYLNWDYYGWFFTNYIGATYKEYLSQSEESEKLITSDGITVDKDTFIKAIAYNSFTFQKDGGKIKIAYGEGHFYVGEAQGA